MKKIFSLIAATAICMAAWAVPAKREFHVYTLTDGTAVELTLAGDEYAHWYEDAAGRIYTRVADNTFELSTKTRAEMAQRRKASVKYRTNAAKRAKKDVGVEPNLAPRGIVILANFSNNAMQAAHTQSVFDELCNSTNCTVNNGHPSAAQFFGDQSNGTYRPVFDVYGPVTLSRTVSYYGSDIVGSDEGDDQHATDAVVEACILANAQYDIDFTQYDSDHDGYVDFVYLIYAGKGQADGGAANTIWPHNWDIESARYYYIDGDANGLNGTVHYCTYTEAECTIDGKILNNYACSSELSGSTMNGIGTLCHEFSHVMGLPDFYDTEYGTNYNDARTPGVWDIMDGGSYNGDGHCPPNYSAWEKSFFGWCTPINPGSTAQTLTLQANGTTGYQPYQINASGTYLSATTSGQCYYIENRQNSGWDSELPGHGLLIWSVNFDQEQWSANAPNNTANSPQYTVVSASGSKKNIGSAADPFPGTRNKTSWTGVTGKPLLNIAETNGVITLTYIEEPGVVVDPFDLVWKVNGQVFATTTSTGTIVMPSTTPDDCGDKAFVGWCKTANYQSETTAPTFVSAGQAAQEGDIFYAVFASQSGEGPAAVSDVLTRATTGVDGTNYADWSNKTLNSTAVYAGQSAGGNSSIQLRSKNSNSGIITTASGGKLAKVTVDWNDNTDGERTLDIYGKNTAYVSPIELYNNASQGTKIGSIKKSSGTELIVSGDYAFVGVRSNNGALYMNSLTITWSGSGVSYSGYTTTCTTTPSDVLETNTILPATVKMIRNGQVVIIRDGKEYNILGVQQ